MSGSLNKGGLQGPNLNTLLYLVFSSHETVEDDRRISRTGSEVIALVFVDFFFIIKLLFLCVTSVQGKILGSEIIRLVFLIKRNLKKEAAAEIIRNKSNNRGAVT